MGTTTRHGIVSWRLHALRVPHKDSVQQGIENIKLKLKKDLLSRDISYFVYYITSKVTFEFDQILDKIDSEVGQIERDVMDGVHKNYTIETFSLRKTLIYFRRAIKTNKQ